jgi:UDP-N-acetylmuramyl pentapeptide phosphotransferase/UDP-N-acetylglucosamine-1-phosphate transferase
MLGLLFILSAFVAYIVTRLTIRLSARRGVLDFPNERSSHSQPVPRLGGIGILAALVLSLAVYALMSATGWAGKAAFTRDVSLMLVAGMGMALTGLYDDFHRMAPATKFLMQLALAGIVVALGTRLESVTVLDWGPFSLGALAIPVTILWLTGFANIFNFMDGINGLAAVTAAVYSGIFAVFGAWQGRPDLAVASLVVVGGCLGFLPYNVPKARTFMGDTGSLLLGIVLALLVVQLAQHSPNPASLIGLLLVCALYLWDSGYTLLRRLWRGENIFRAHRSHLYQRLARLGLSHVRITLLYLGLHLLMGSLGLAYVSFAGIMRPVILVIAGVVLVGFTGSIYRLEHRAAGPKCPASVTSTAE